MPDHVIRAAASLDLLHVSALVHDDVMDSSATRRGLPAAHVQLAGRHAASGRRGDATEFGRAGAILLGDLLLMWSVEQFTDCGAPATALSAALPLVAAVRAEVTGGQYLDITAQTRSPLDARTDPDGVLALVRRVVEYKTARYTVVRPLQIGAALKRWSPSCWRRWRARFSSGGRSVPRRRARRVRRRGRTGKPPGMTCGSKLTV